MITRGLLFLITLIICAVAVSAADFSVEHEILDNNILYGEQASYKLIVSSNQEFDDKFRLTAPDVSWTVQTQPLYHYFGGFEVKSMANGTTTLLLNPLQKIPVGQYRVQLNIESVETGEKQSEFFIINVKSPTPPLRDYLAAVDKIVDMPNRIDPREPFTIKINLVNLNPKDIPDVVVSLESEIINKEVHTPLSPLEKKTVEVPVTLNALTAPQKDTLKVLLTIENQTLQPLKEQFEIMGYSDFEEKEEPSGGFLSSKKTIICTNNGNVGDAKTIEVKTNFFKKIFTKAEPEAYTINRKDGSYLAWEVSLGPQESTSIKVTTSYLILFVIFVAIIAVIAIYYFMRSPVEIKKEAAVIGFKEGGISDLKIVLHIKNRGQKTFQRLKVVDRIPIIADIEKEIEIGTLKPTKIFQHGKGTVIKWDVDALEKYEERVLSYRIKSKLSILGGFNLPAAILKFEDEKAKERMTKSNKALVDV
ncbi:MAG: hypothetical protein GY861_23635 [bacterium]|nr:hypothetical protein [bacterium]